MPRYQPITEIMPLASMVTGAAVTAALCDQIRDNLVAIHDGWWFRARKSTTTTTAVSVATPVVLDTITVSQTGEDEGSIFLANGSVTVNRTGIWVVGGHFSTSTTGVGLVLVDASDALGGLYVTQDGADNGNAKSGFATAGSVEVTTVPTTFRLDYFFDNAVVLAANDRSQVLWGYRSDHDV